MEKVKNLVLRHVIQIVVLLFLYFICRALFIATYYNELNFSESFSMIKVFFGGIRFDLSSIIVANSIYFILAFFPAPRINHQVYQQGLKGLFILTNSFFLLLNLVDIAYFPFVSKRMQADTFLFVTGEKGEEFFQLLPGFLLQYWHLLILYIVIVFGV
ncbi:MAG: hypothetical protein OEY34_05720, partial [Cyclobacteriaceae bacterium]|nr:hypothetical protein [Cyclobacteriaceae bacterium]